ncbi:MAG: YerC/YecD family TrpR-related protein [Bacilli bacterium]
MDHQVHELYQAFLQLETVEECEAFLKDLCTIKEVQAMAQRWHAARLLASGKTFLQIEALTGISSTTLSRVSQAYQYGKGYRELVKKSSR